MRRSLAAALSVFILCAAQFPASGFCADQAAVNAETERITGSIMSPYCPGRLLRDCPSGQAAQLTDNIRERLAGGENAQGIIDSLIDNFGEEIRAAPKAEGFGIVAWAAPAVFLFAALLFAFFWLKSRSQSEESSPAPLDKDEEARLESELH